MNKFLLLLALFTIINCQAFISRLSKDEKKLFQEFRKKYKKQYATKQELEYRFQIFISNLNRLEQEPVFKGPSGQTLLGNQSLLRNRGQQKKFLKELNQFADLTDNEFSNSYLLPQNILYKPQTPKNIYRPKKFQNRQSNNQIQGRSLQQISDANNLPRKVDWVQQGKVTPVKSQKRCNICYGFSALAALESANLIKNNRSISLSEQEILDCSTENYGCKGGQPSAVFDYVVKNNLSLDKDYPYIGKENDKCYKDSAQVPNTTQGRRLQQGRGNNGQGRGNSGQGRGQSQQKNPNLNGTKNENQTEQTNEEVDPNTLLGFSFNKNDYNTQYNYNPYQQQQYNYNPYQQQQYNYYDPYQQQQYNYYDPSQQFNYQDPTQNNNNQTPTQTRQKFSDLLDYQYVNQNIIELLKAVNDQPVAIAHYVSSQFKFYAEGIYDGEGCENINTVNHSSLLVGYDLNAEIPYMLFKNSWGELWGEKGYYKMKIGELLTTNKGLCLVAGTPFNVIPFLKQLNFH